MPLAPYVFYANPPLEIMKVIIVGCGRVGAQLAMLLSAEEHDVTIMDVNARSFNKLDPAFSGTALVGNGASENSLRDAGIEGADAFVAVTDEDNHNIMSAQLAKHLFNIPKVVCRLYDPHLGEFYQSMGLEIISPTLVFAELLKEKVVE